MRGWFAIVNPAAGRRGEADAAVRVLTGHSHLASVVATTTAPGHGTELARSAARFHGIVAVGGDGTIAEVLAGMDIARQRLAVIPAGHGNCLARDLGFTRPDAAVAAIERGHARPIDLMEVDIEYGDARTERRRAASTVAVGYVCDVVRNGLRLAFLGRRAYAAAAAITVPLALGARVALDDGARALPGLTGVVVNNTAHLGNFRAFVGASLDDGRLEVMENAACWPRQMLHNAAVLAGRRAFGAARMRQSPRATVRLEAPGRLMVDGEILEGVTRFTATCCRSGVACIAEAR
jgi:diacylglycerol kinase family enzyme